LFERLQPKTANRSRAQQTPGQIAWKVAASLTALDRIGEGASDDDGADGVDGAKRSFPFPFPPLVVVVGEKLFFKEDVFVEERWEACACE